MHVKVFYSPVYSLRKKIRAPIVFFVSVSLMYAEVFYSTSKIFYVEHVAYRNKNTLGSQIFLRVNKALCCQVCKKRVPQLMLIINDLKIYIKNLLFAVNKNAVFVFVRIQCCLLFFSISESCYLYLHFPSSLST